MTLDLADRPGALAAALVAAGARLVVVGGAARRLRGSAHRPRDLDVVVAPGDLGALDRALRVLGERLPPARTSTLRVATSYGLLDVFVGPPPAAGPVEVGAVAVPVAA